jgi:hypothetical protein
VLKELGNKLALLATKRNIAVYHYFRLHLMQDFGAESTHHKSHLWRQCSPGASIGYDIALQSL